LTFATKKNKSIFCELIKNKLDRLYL